MTKMELDISIGRYANISSELSGWHELSNYIKSVFYYIEMKTKKGGGKKEMKTIRSWIVKLEEIKSYQFLCNPWTESNLVRFLIQILSHRERLIKLFDLRIVSTLLLRDLRKNNQYFLIKGIVVLTLAS
uniref:Ycf2 N-terminal domain-containing protein n=1 Tax=Keteleeria davidiana TaxID=3324 RepID=B7ZIM1_KETDA|nr:hypothetical protein KedaC_p014 [Keteleeria davidiana]BAH11388.1 hypothetical protein [Keteleeria davidiana]